MKNYFQIPWTLKDLIIITGIVVVLLAGELLAAIFFLPSEIFNASGGMGIFFLIAFLIQTITFLLPLFIYTKIKYGLKKNDLGFKKINPLKAIMMGLGNYILFLLIIFIITFVIIHWDLQIPGFQAQEEILPLFGKDILSLTIAGFIIIILAPIAEEIFFRGFIFRTLANKTGIHWGSVLSAFIFALMHFQIQSIIPLFILGLLMNSLVIRTKSIYPSIAFHIINNAVTFSIQLLFFLEVIEIDQLI